MTKDQAIEYFKTTRALAAALNIKAHTISEWQTFPPIHQLRLEAMTGGALRADDDAWYPANPRYPKPTRRTK